MEELIKTFMERKSWKIRLMTFVHVIERYFGYLVLLLIVGWQHHEGVTQGKIRRVLFAEETLKTWILSTETAQRGYLLTDDLAYKAEYISSVSLYQYSFQTLKMLLKDDEINLHRLNAIQDLMVKKIDEMQDTIRLHDNGDPNGALARVKTNEGYQYMSQVRVLLNQIKADKEVQDVTWLGFIGGVTDSK